MLKNKIGVRVAKLKRKFSRACFFEMREIIADKAVSQRVTVVWWTRHKIDTTYGPGE